MLAEFAPHAVTAILLLVVLVEMRTGKIPNLLTLLPIFIFVLVAATVEDRSVIAWQLGLGVGTFCVGLLLFAFAGFGAGAVKLMAGVALFIPLAKGWWALAIFVTGLFVVSMIVGQLRKYKVGAKTEWNVFTSRRSIPMSVPITATFVIISYLF